MIPTRGVALGYLFCPFSYFFPVMRCTALFWYLSFSLYILVHYLCVVHCSAPFSFTPPEVALRNTVYAVCREL